jgi:hypothetical protein
MKMLPPFNRKVLAILNVFWVAFGSFTLGGYAVSFSGSRWAWLALVCSIVVILFAGTSLVRLIWRAA